MEPNCDLCNNKWKCSFLTDKTEDPQILRIHSRTGVQEVLNKDRIIKTCGNDCPCAFSSDSVPLGCNKQEFYKNGIVECASFTYIHKT